MRYVITPQAGDEKCVSCLQGLGALDVGDGDWVVWLEDGQLAQFRRHHPSAAVEKAAQWGGYREGAGRPALSENEPTERLSVTLPQSMAEYLRRNGNASAEVRRLVEAAIS